MVKLRPPGDQGAGKGDAEAPPEISHQVEHRRGVPHLLLVDPGHGQGGQRHEDEPHAEAHDDSRPGHGVEIGGEVEPGHHQHGPGRDHRADEENRLRVDPGDEPAGDGHGDHRHEAPGAQDPAGEKRRVAHQGLQTDREHDEAAEEREERGEGDDVAGGKGQVLEDVQIDDGVLGVVLVDGEKDEPGQGDHAEPQDERGGEPVLPLALVQDDLEAPDPDGQEGEAHVIHPDLPGPGVIRVDDEDRRHEDRNDPDGDVDEKDPVPRPVVGDPAPQERPDDGPDHDADPEDRHGRPVLMPREALQQDGLRDRLQRAPGESLEDAEEDQCPQAPGGAAEKGAEGEQADGDEQEALAPEEPAEPARHGDDDGIGGQVGGDDPGRLVDPRGEAAPDVVERDVDDGGVDDHHERGQHHRDGHEPFVHDAPGVLQRSTRIVGTTDIPTLSR